jgi:hypothetical protein
MLATVVDWKALGEVVVYAFAGAVALSVLFTSGVLLVEPEGEGQGVAPARRALGGLLLLVCLGLVAFGLYIMFSSK